MKLLEYLDQNDSTYQVSRHVPVFTAQQMAAAEHISGMNVAKPVVIKAEDMFYMCVLPACCKIDLNVLQRHLGVDQVDLATESEMADIFPECPIGAEPPFGGLYGLLTFMDTRLADDEYIIFQSGTHEDSVQMDTQEFIKLAQPRILSFSYHML